MDPTILAIITAVELAQGIPPGLLAAVCTVESQGDHAAVVKQDGRGGRESRGLCQIQERTMRHVCPGVSFEELYRPDVNARCGGRYLTWQFRRYGSWDAAVIAFNRGSWKGQKTNEYLRRVMKEYGYYGRRKEAHSAASHLGSRRLAYAAGSSEAIRAGYSDTAENRANLRPEGH